MENTITGRSLAITACSTRFMAKVVLPMEGRPAMITRSEGCRPEVISSRSRNPVERPVISPFMLNSSSMRSTALASSSLMPMGPPDLGRSSLIWNTSRSASSSSSSAGRPWGLKAPSAIWLAARISLRSVARSRTMSA